MSYQKMLVKQQKLDAKIQELELQLNQLPPGSLICTKNGKHFKWFHLLNNQRIYLPKKQRNFASQLAPKKLLTLQLKNLKNEKKAVDAYLKYRLPSADRADLFLQTHPEFQNLLSSYYKPLSQELFDWANEDFEKNVKNSEHLIHKTLSGNIVRSKSEALIDTILHINKIPFRYECALHLGEITLFPDFTICHPHTGQIYYWEHYGLIDDPSYSQNSYSKLQLYTSHGIIPSIHLITTFETKEYPLTTDVIEKIIHDYFLT